ncbi:MAG TPA: histidine kinase dimerization/phospho-acceptor domain-containing protein, partial [Polyangiaceae bacterium]|nr:histidine kinase dimerization/phospho-acceptor domain-containing protein [Polyangiaceae bacterium]
MKVVPDSSEPARRSEPIRAFVDVSSVEAKRAETERMASLGTLAAGIAHEINNPLAYVLGSLEIGQRELADLQALMQEGSGEELRLLAGVLSALGNARDGAERVRHIVKDFMDFSRKGAAGAQAVNVEAVLDATIRVAWNEIRHRARLVKRYAGISRVSGDEAR